MRRQQAVANRSVRGSGIIPPSFTWVLFAVLGVASFAFLGNPPAPPPAPAALAPSAPPPSPAAVIETRISAEGLDRHNRRLPFTVYILSLDLSWKLESTTALDGGQNVVTEALSREVNRAREVFCIGTASEEGPTRREEARAAKRAVRLAGWVAQTIEDPRRTRLFTLNAGQYKGAPGLASPLQRKAVIIATGEHEDAVDLGEGLASGLKQKQQDYPLVESLLHSYSRSKVWLRLPRGHAMASLQPRLAL